MLHNWHGFSATSEAVCGTFSVQHDADNLARFFVPDESPELAPQPCQTPGTFLVPHSRTLTQELIPSGTTCQTDVSTYRSLRRLTLTYRTNKVTHDRAREMKVSR